MMIVWGATALLVIGVFYYAATLLLRKPRMEARRQQVLAQDFPAAWLAIIERRCKFYKRMPDDLREVLKKRVMVFIAEKKFEACGDLEEVTEEMRVVIAAQACLLLVAVKKHNYFCKLKSILLYPGAFHRGRERLFSLHDEEAGEGKQVLLGESWGSGSVILAWENTLRGALNEDDGQNVVMHEFAHQLDQVDGQADGAPILASRADYEDWAKVLGHDYEKLVKLTEAGKRDLIDAYGATNPAEFFAVATETFFERPRRLRKKHRELYDELREYYGQDPAEWNG
ncbi:MAG: zinc-dependent peptidase [Verrucomicrobiales bacterium]|nr:zinc-dependent peptidase [Verrucomicrobiales bacterium]